MEVDFGESWVDIAGVPCKVKYLVATLPFSNAYFAKAYPIERLESLLDGIESAFRYFGGIVDRVVLDNTSLAVKDVLAGRDRVQTEAFEAFRGGYPLGAALLRRRPKGLLPAARQELLDPSKAWWGGRRGRLADRPRYSHQRIAGRGAPLVLPCRGKSQYASRSRLAS